MSLQSEPKRSERYSLFRRKPVRKENRPVYFRLILLGVLLVCLVSLVVFNRHMFDRVRHYQRFLNAENTLKQKHSELKIELDRLQHVVIPLNPDAKDELLKSRYIKVLADSMTMRKVRLDSFQARVEKNSDFVAVKIELSALAPFPKQMRVLYDLGSTHPEIKLERFRLRLGGNGMVRGNFTFHISGRRLAVNGRDV